MGDEKKKKLHHRLRFKYRLSILDEGTWNERWHIRLNGIGVILFTAAAFVVTLVIFSLVILYTPIRNYLPGYTENIRKQLIEESVRMDSLQTSMQVQRQYLDMIKQIMAGEVSSDTVQRLDSLQIIMREELLEAKSQLTEDFIAQYEQRGRDNLLLFDIPESSSTLTFFRPVSGVVSAHYAPEKGIFATSIKTDKKTNISAVLAGMVVYVQYELSDTYTLMIQHDGYLSIYRHMASAFRRVSDYVQAGEIVGLTDERHDFSIELWQNGHALNPEDVIALQ